MSKKVDQSFVAVARKRHCKAGLARVIISEARERGIPISLGFALIEHESGFKKVFGHDPTIFVGAGTVTKAKKDQYLRERRASGNRLMQGVGEGQPTWWETQDLVERHGGLHQAKANVTVSFLTLAARIHEHGYAKGVERYNGSGPDARAYSRSVRASARDWHKRLTAI